MYVWRGGGRDSPSREGEQQSWRWDTLSACVLDGKHRCLLFERRAMKSHLTDFWDGVDSVVKLSLVLTDESCRAAWLMHRSPRWFARPAQAPRQVLQGAMYVLIVI